MRKFVLICTILSAAIWAGYYFHSDQQNTTKALPTPVAINDTCGINYKYGYNEDSITTILNKVNKNETLTGILSKLNINKEIIEAIKNKSTGNFNHRQLKAGTEYTIIVSKNDQNPKCIILNTSASESIFFRFDSIAVFKEFKKTDTIERIVHAAIKGSLYETFEKVNTPASLAAELSRIYSRKIDFFKLKEGDSFSIIYDEISVEGKAISVDKIHSICFNRNDKKYYAFNFSKKDKSEFYDEEGNSMEQGGFLKAPLKFFRITSKFTKKRFHPVQKVFKAHLGTDYAAPTGTPVIAVAEGTILEAKYGVYNGNYVKIKHNQTYSTQYLHLSKIEKGMKPGYKVNQGQTIGYVGSTGLASGPHVCYRFWKNGKQVDPAKEVAKSNAVTLDKKDMKEFELLKQRMLLKMQQELAKQTK
ncbi:MAG: peptidoglycan DD-metalloendopeptidase family protein [Cytophagaceae bacterium]